MKKKKHKAGGDVNITILNQMDAADLEDFLDFLLESLTNLKEEDAADDEGAADGECSANHEDPAGDEYLVIDEDPAAGDEADAGKAYGINDNGEKYVAVIYPEAEPRLERYENCDTLLDRFGNYMSVWQIPEGKNLGVIYDSRCVLDLSGEKYLLGPVIVYCSDESFRTICEMKFDDYLRIRQILSDRVVTLEADRHEFRVIRM